MIIYLATNKINGKRYVGLTKRSLKARWNQHVNIANKEAKTYFHKAIAKYGRDAFDVVPVISALSQDSLAFLETQLIKDLCPEYNQTGGGEVTLGRKYDDATKERIRKANTGKKRTLEQRQRNSHIKKQQFVENPQLKNIATLNLNNARHLIDEVKRRAAVGAAAKNRVWSNESKVKLSASCMGRKYSQEVIDKTAAKKRKSILCSDGRVFTCREEAAKLTGVSPRSVFRVCNGEYPSVKGLKFSYYRSFS